MGTCGKICSYICTCQFFLSVVLLLWVYMLQDIARVNANSPLSQTLAEMWWWSKFVVLTQFWITVEPLSLDYLQNQHSHLGVRNYWVHNDSTAAERFFKDSTDWRLVDKECLVLRGIWANNSENMLRYLNSTDNLRKYLDMDRNYSTLVAPVDEHWYYDDLPFEKILDDMENHSDEKLTSIYFSYEFAAQESQPFIWKWYNDLYTKLGFDFNDVNQGSMVRGKRLFTLHSFLYYGTKQRTRLHAAPPADYFTQVANKKKWRLIHKRYFPYMNLYRHGSLGIMRTPEYYITDYAEDRIPYVDILVEPGDMMYFSEWQVHEVWNTEPTLGLAIGVRPAKPIGTKLFQEPVASFVLHNLLLIPQAIIFLLQKHRTTYTHGSKTGMEGCISQGGQPHTWGYNGTTITRYDLKMIDGTCVMAEKVPNYQVLESSKQISTHSWMPAQAKFEL